MGNAEKITFVPVLTVMADYGNAPFLWLVDNPDQGGVGPNWCDGRFWDESLPMSEGLWRKFADWAIEFDSTSFYSDDFNADDWDWLAFRSPFPEPRRLCERIVSGGQTGADRGALDFAIKHGYIHGGWAPHGRLAEDGVIPAKYQLTEMAEGGYRQRTRRNVVDSDATLIVNLGELDGGTLATQLFAEKSGKPFLVVQADSGISEKMVDSVIAWLLQHDVKILNVAGPRESKRPGICRLTSEMLTAVDALLQPK